MPGPSTKRHTGGFLIMLLMAADIAAQSPSVEFARQTAMQSITPEALQGHIEFLGSDALMGRGTGTPGGERAARYLAAELHKLDLIPMGDDSSYFQMIPMHGSMPLPQCQFQLFAGEEEISFKLWDDYLLYNAGAQTFVPMPAPLVFVGYGIVAPEFDYNDYQAFEVEGKIVVFLSGEPLSNEPAYFAGPEQTVHANPAYKQLIAISRGARGSFMIPNPREERGRDWEYWAKQFAFEDVTLAYSITKNLSVMLNPQSAARLFHDAPFSLSQVFEMDAKQAMRSFPLRTSASFKGVFRQRDFLAANVVGMLLGSDPALRETYLLLTAHYDHLGVGPAVQGDSIYNGVFDNAAGVAAVLEVARAFTALPERPKRSIMFLFLTGEEKGLLGSTYYVDHAIVPLHRTIANLNVDGLALFDTFKDVTGVGAEYSTLSEFLTRVAAELGLQVSSIPALFTPAHEFTRSDQIVFAQAGIPALLVMEGVNYHHTSIEAGLQRFIEWGENIYHTPQDDLRQSLNYLAALQHCRLLFALSHALAREETAPQWKAGTPFINIRLQTIAEQR